jgi:hypothetical protein
MANSTMNRFFGIYTKSNSKYWQSVNIHLNEEFRNLVREAIRNQDENCITNISMLAADILIERLFIRIVAIFEELNLPSDTSFKVKLFFRTTNKRYSSITKTKVVNTLNRDYLNTQLIIVLTKYLENHPDTLVDRVLINFRILDLNLENKHDPTRAPVDNKEKSPHPNFKRNWPSNSSKPFGGSRREYTTAAYKTSLKQIR